jgi:TolB-like protein
MPPPEAIRAALGRLLASREFVHSARLARFLRFAVEETIAGRGAQLKECVIGMEVFDCDASYDSRLDPIVRVEARRLRAKLERHYRGEGAAEPVRIEFPKGSYAPVFQSRDARAGSETIAVAPFQILSREDPENEAFGGGLTEELIHALTRVEGLRVVAWRPESGAEAGRLLQGSVRRRGETLRVAVRLVDLSDRSVLWSEVYERRWQDVFAIQDDLVGAMVRAMPLTAPEGLVCRPRRIAAPLRLVSRRQPAAARHSGTLR